MRWTDDAVDRLKAMWGEGATATECAHVLGATRCGVLGKVRRLDLQRRRAPNRDTERFERMVDLIADENMSIEEAAAEAGIPLETADYYWTRLCAEHGAQCA